jgi:hypothetical protein
MKGGAAVMRTTVVIAAALAFLPAAAPGATPLRVRASVAFAPVAATIVDAFARESGIPAVLERGEPDPPAGADVVIGDDSELQRLLEAGVVDERSSVDLGTLPWVLVAPAGAPAGAVEAAGASADGIAVLAGRAGREARISLSAVAPSRLTVSADPEALGRASVALVPSSLAGAGERRATTLPPLIATAALVVESKHVAETQRLLAFLKSDTARRLLGRQLTPVTFADAAESEIFALAVTDYWIPACSVAGDSYNDPQQALGAPNAANLGGKDLYSGMVSLGQGGWLIVDMGQEIVDHAGYDLRVFQTTASEPVTVYAADNPSGPFTRIGLRVPCGYRSNGVYSHHCDFDLHDGGVAQARYFKIEDGEIYPCKAAGTKTEGADIDAVEALNQ